MCTKFEDKGGEVTVGLANGRIRRWREYKVCLVRSSCCSSVHRSLALHIPHLSPRSPGVYLHISQPGLQCADLVFDEMQRIAAQCEGTELTRFPCLRDRIVEVRKG